MSGKSSSYRHRMFLQTYVQTQDEYRQPVRQWVDSASMWCRLDVAYKGMEMMGGQRNSQVPQQASLTQMWVVTRYRSDITISPTQRVRFGERIFQVNAVYDDLGLQREIKILCTEVQR